MGHNICFEGEIWKIIPKLSFLPLLIWSTELLCCFPYNIVARPRGAIGRAPDSQVRGPGFDTLSGNILSFLLPLFQEGQLSVTGKSMCTKYFLTA